MAEIRLICPGCAAEYRLSEGAIPPGGREVECSGCGRVWHATPAPADATAAPTPLHESDTGQPPALSRRLPVSVLDILRDEVEYERRARAAEGTAVAAPSAGRSSQPGPAAETAPVPVPRPDPGWPATTITTAITRHGAPMPAQGAEAALPAAPVPAFAEPRPEPAPASETAPAASAPPAAPPRARQAVPASPAALPAAGTAPQSPASSLPAARPAASTPRPARRAYAAGFGLAVLLAAAVLGLYLLAPSLADGGPFGDSLQQLRARADEARLWLQDRASGLAR